MSSFAKPFVQSSVLKSVIAFHTKQLTEKNSRFDRGKLASDVSPHHASMRLMLYQRPCSMSVIQPRGHLCLASLEQRPMSSKETEEKYSVTNPEMGKTWEASDSDGWQWTMTLDELVAYAVLVVAVMFAPLTRGFQWSATLHFLFLAIWSVYVGSHRSLGRSPPQKMSLKQGLAVPVISSFTLFGFYCLLRFFPDIDLRAYISAYLALVGALAVANNLMEPLRLLFSRIYSPSWQFDLPSWVVQEDGAPICITLTPATIIAGLVGIGVSLASKQAEACFSFNNFIAVCIVTELLQLLSVGSFTTAAAMLCGLLFYDVFWVFGSSHIFGDNVMVTVATSASFDGPMKLIFPQVKATSSNPYSILGLGDVAVPGLLTALMLRFDRSRSKPPHQVCQDTPVTPSVQHVDAGLFSTLWPDKTYFNTCLISYIIGLGITAVANDVTGAPQPALLYLVPCLLFGVLLMASLRSESSLLLNFKDETSPLKAQEGSVESQKHI